MPTVGAPDFDCTFCRIVAGRAPARWVSAPDPDTQARLNAGWSPGLGSGGAACFTNRLRWERVMLLVVPLGHLTQQEMWRGSGIGAVAKLAVEIGLRQCPEGFRLLSNFGRAAHQSQPHAHLHIVSGIADDLESAPRTGTGHSAELQPIHVSGVADSSAPLTLILAPEGNASQIGFWESTLLTSVARKAVDFAEARSPAGYRFRQLSSRGVQRCQEGTGSTFTSRQLCRGVRLRPVVGRKLRWSRCCCWKDPQMEEALQDRTFRRFVGLGLQDDTHRLFDEPLSGDMLGRPGRRATFRDLYVSSPLDCVNPLASFWSGQRIHRGPAPMY